MRWLVAAVALGAAACGAQPQGAAVSSAVYTPAHRSVGEAAREFFAIKPVAQQPIPFPHKVHLA